MKSRICKKMPNISLKACINQSCVHWPCVYLTTTLNSCVKFRSSKCLLQQHGINIRARIYSCIGTCTWLHMCRVSFRGRGHRGYLSLEIHPSYNTHAQLQQTDLWTVFRNSLSGVKQSHLSPYEA